jgi:hypothetical protein
MSFFTSPMASGPIPSPGSRSSLRDAICVALFETRKNSAPC